MVTYTNGERRLEITKEQFYLLIQRIKKESARRRTLSQTELGRKILENEGKRKGV